MAEEFFNVSNEIISDDEDIIHFDIVKIRNQGDTFLLEKLEFDDVDPPNIYLEDFNVFNLDLDEISSRWEVLGFSYKPQTSERVIEIDDKVKIVKFLTLVNSITSLVEGWLIVKQTIPNIIDLFPN